MPNDYLFPFPLGFHIIFSVLGALIFLIQYVRKKYAYQLLMAFAIPSTLLVYFCKTETTFMILGIEELVILLLVIIFIFRAKKIEEKKEKEEKASKASEAGRTEENHEDSNS